MPERAHYQADPERHRAERRARYQRDPQHGRAIQARYASEHRDEYMLRYHATRCLRHGIPAELALPQWLWLLARYGRRCAYCGAEEPFVPVGPRHHRTSARITLDHPVALALGGAHALGNAVPCCPACNTAKNKAPLDDWLAECQAEHGLDARAFRRALADHPALWAAEQAVAQLDALLRQAGIDPDHLAPPLNLDAEVAA